MPTNFSLSITLIIQDQPVTISSDSFDTFVFTLPRPIDFGTWDTFTKYLADNWGVTIRPLPETGVPALDNGYKQLTGNLHLQLTTLTYNKPAQYFEFGVSLGFDRPEPLITGLEFKAVGVNVRVQPESFALGQALTRGAVSLTLPTATAAAWANADRIFIMGATSETIEVASVAGSTLTFKNPAASDHAVSDQVMLVREKQTQPQP